MRNPKYEIEAEYSSSEHGAVLESKLSCDKPLIFLDIDGVLNTHNAHPKTRYNTIDRDKAELFNNILTSTDSEFVLSSSWRYLYHANSMTLDGLRNLLYSHWLLADRFVGVTREDREDPSDDRGQQITDFLEEFQKDAVYLILDNGGVDKETKKFVDMGLSRHGLGTIFILIDTKYGLTFDNAVMAINHIRQQQRERIMRELKRR